MSRTHISVERDCLVIMGLVYLVFCFAVANPAQGQTLKALHVPHQHTVEMDGMNSPLIALAKALHQNPRASRFRVKWFQMVLSEDYNSVALYDRSKHTLIFDCHGHWDGGRMHERIVYTKVTDEVISRAAKTNQGSRQNDFLAGGFRAYFDTLAFYGAKVQSKHQR